MKATKAQAYTPAYEFPEVAQDVRVDEPKGKFLGNLRIGRVSYENHEIRTGGTATIGEMIDEHIRNTIQGGNLVNEVSIHFETIEEQHAIAELYGR